jgi:uncharacterized membrane protein
VGGESSSPLSSANLSKLVLSLVAVFFPHKWNEFSLLRLLQIFDYLISGVFVLFSHCWELEQSFANARQALYQ